MSQVTIDRAMSIAMQHRQAGRLGEAEAVYRHILAVQPNFPDALHRLGLIAAETGHHPEAVEMLRQAIAAAPDNPLYYAHLAKVLHHVGQFDDAVACYQRTLALNPDLIDAQFGLASAWHDKGELGRAIAGYERALAINPNIADIHISLGVAFRYLGQFDKAIACFQRAVEIAPNSALAHSNLGGVWSDKGQTDNAIACYQRALALNPNVPGTHSNLGNAWNDQGEHDRAVACYRRALALQRDFVIAHDNLLRTLPFEPAFDPENLRIEFERWNRQFSDPLKRFVQPHASDRDPERPLRIGYVSPDFRSHPVARFILPLLVRHDRTAHQIFCYSSCAAPDDWTATIKSHCDVWRPIAGLSDRQAAQLVRDDRIDILVDLAMHTDGNRLLLFAHKPAPVQVTYLAYAGGVALDAIDYRLTDRYLDPNPADDRYYMQETFRLPGTYWCYDQPGPTPPAGELPAAAAGAVTFGCLNKFAKVTRNTLETWAALLNACPSARLLLHAGLGSHRNRTLQFMRERGVGSDRVEFVERMSMADYFKMYDRMDIALDPFPFSGGTTTCDALWMGVPVVTLAGRLATARAGVSILSHLGLTELIAQSPADYVRIASDLASDLPRLGGLRSSLRQRMVDSPLLDADRFARDIEAAYRTMWRRWCGKP